MLGVSIELMLFSMSLRIDVFSSELVVCLLPESPLMPELPFCPVDPEPSPLMRLDQWDLHHDHAELAVAVRAVFGLFLLTGSPGQAEEKHVVRRSEVVARPGGRRGADEHPAVGILLEAIDRLLPLGERVIAHQRDAAEPGLLAEFLQRSHGRLELAEQDHLVLGVELAQQVHRHANLHRFQVTPQRAESREDRSVLEAQHLVLLAFLGGEGHLQQLPLLALEAG